LKEALTIAQVMPTLDSMEPAEALAKLAPYLSESLLPRALEIARSLQLMDMASEASPRALATAALAAYLPESVGDEVFREALMAARALPESDGHVMRSPRAQALAALLPHLPERHQSPRAR
jgi:hypothetical protein